MPEVLMKSVSGIRGIVGNGFDLDLIAKAAGAMAAFTKKGTIVVGRDSRPTGESISMNIISSLNLQGCNVVDLGIVPTPTVQIMVEELKAQAGIVVSASHNPVEWNAFKLINSTGTFFNSSEVNRFFKLMEKEPLIQKWDKIGTFTRHETADELHIKKVLKLVNVKKIKSMNFTVVLDSVNGAGSTITPKLLEALGCKVKTVHCTPNGLFPRVAEPLPENLGDLSKAVKKNKAHVGFAQDPDADRLAIVDELGQPIGEEYTVTLAADHILKKSKTSGPVVVNLSTTKAVEDIAKSHGAPFKRSKVGEINVVETMKKNNALIGGEGNGGVIAPEIHLGRDSLIGIAYILEMMAQRKSTVSELKASMPQYFMKKGKIKLKKDSSEVDILKNIEAEFKGEKFSKIDGLRIDFVKNEKFKNSWVHLRSSNTEPIFRIIAESDSIEKTEELYNFFLKIMK